MKNEGAGMRLTRTCPYDLSIKSHEITKCILLIHLALGKKERTRT